MGLTLRKPDANLLSFDRFVGLLGGAVSHARGRVA